MPSKNIVDFANQIKTYMRGAEVVEGKNLLKPFTTSKTENGVTFTCNADGTVSVSGTPTANAFITTKTPLVAGKYLLNGLGSATGASYDLLNLYKNGVVVASYIGIYSGTGDNVIDLTSYDFDEAEFTIKRSANGTPMSGTVKPMLRDFDESNDTYEPYYVPVKDSKLDIADQQVLGAWNLLENTATTKTVAGVTWTVNADKSVTPSNNPTGNSDFVIVGTRASASGSINLPPSIVPGKTYYASINKDLPSSTNGEMYIYFWDSNLSNQTMFSVKFGEVKEFTVPSNASKMMVELYYASSSTVATGTVFYPQIALEPNQPYVPYAMTNRELTDVGFFLKETIDSTMDLDNVKETGLYFISSSPTHAPENAAYCSLLVHARTTTDIRQIIFRYSDAAKCIYMRANGGSWTSWVKFTGTVVQ